MYQKNKTKKWTEIHISHLTKKCHYVRKKGGEKKSSYDSDVYENNKSFIEIKLFNITLKSLTNLLIINDFRFNFLILYKKYFWNKTSESPNIFCMPNL